MVFESLRQFCPEPYGLEAIARMQRGEDYPGLIPWSKVRSIVRLIEIPSFQAFSVWMLGQEKDLWRVRRIEWDHILDRKTSVAAPTTFGADAQLATEIGHRILDELAAIVLPPFSSAGSYGLDGTSRAVVFGDFWCSGELSWWEDPPEQWKSLAGWYDRAVAVFEEVLPVSKCRGRYPNPRI